MKESILSKIDNHFNCGYPIQITSNDFLRDFELVIFNNHIVMNSYTCSVFSFFIDMIYEHEPFKYLFEKLGLSSKKSLDLQRMYIRHVLESKMQEFYEQHRINS